MMSKILLLCFCLIFGELNSWEWDDTIEHWKEQAEREEAAKECPFSVENLDRYMTDLTLKYGTPTRTTTYDFPLNFKDEKTMYVYEGRDERLKVRVRLEFNEKNAMKPICCLIENDYNRPWWATDIAIFQIKAHGRKIVYLVSFYDSQATLVITRCKESTVTAQWAILKKDIPECVK